MSLLSVEAISVRMPVPSRRFSSMVSPPNTSRPSGTMEKPSLAMSSGALPAISRPAKRMKPSRGVTTPAMALSSVDLPAPLGPVTNRVSPSLRLKLALRSAVSGMLAAAIGLILVTQTGTVDIQMGANLMLVAFVATVIGGLGSLPGAVVAGYLIGAATVIMQVVLPPDARPFRDAFVYGAVIVMLIWRPNGLFSAKAAKQRV